MPGRRGRTRSDDDIAEGAESLSVLDLDDPEIGIRPEDRFAAIPPGPRLVPRRLHDESTRAPVVLLAGLLVVFVLGSWLGSVGTDGEPARPAATIPILDADTGTSLLLVGADTVTEIEVGAGDPRPGSDAAVTALLRDRPARPRVLPSATPGRAWIVGAATEGTSMGREVELGTGASTGAVQVEGAIVGATAHGLVVQAEPMTPSLVGFDGTPIRVLAHDSQFLGAAGTLVATRSENCGDSPCPIVVHDLVTGTARELPVDLAARGMEAGSLSPDGRLLAYARSDGVETRGVFVDVELGTTTPFRARAINRDATGPAAFAWSPGGDWLFLAIERNGLDAIATGDGTNYRVDTDLPPFTAILTR